MDVELTSGLQGQKKRLWQEFLGRAGLEADEGLERTALVWEDGELIATGSRQGNLLKCIAVDDAHQGEGLTGTLLTHLRQDAFQAGHKHLFLYTKPKNKYMFSSLFFYPIAQTQDVLLMENKQGGIREFLNTLPEGSQDGTVGAAVMNCNPFMDSLVGVAVNGGECDIIITTKNGQCIRFDNGDVRPIGRVSQGVRGILLEEGDSVISMNVVTSDDQKMLVVTEKGFGKRVPVSEYRVQTRGGKGVTTGDLRDKTGLLAGAVLVGEDDDVMLICDDGTIIRMAASDINVYKRAALGVSVMRVGDDANIVGVARADKEPDEELPGEGNSSEETQVQEPSETTEE